MPPFPPLPVRLASALLSLSLAAAVCSVGAATTAMVARPSATPRLPVSPGHAVELRGEVVEVSCYLREARRGEAHKGCALACLKNGGELGIVEDGTGALYPLAGDTPATDPSAKLRDHVAEHIAVRGTLYERAGSRILVIDSVKRLD